MPHQNGSATPLRRRPAVAGRRSPATPSPVPRADLDREDLDTAEPTETVGNEAAESEIAPRRGRAVITLLVLLTVFAGVAAAFGIAANPVPEDVTRNVALTDAAATSSVLGQVNRAVETVFSFDFGDTAKTQAAAQNLLRDRAVTQYNQLFEQVKQLAPAQKLVLTTTIRATSVTGLEDDQARLLVLADQRSTRGDTNQTSNAAAQLSVVAKKTGDTWQITDLTVL